MLRSTATVPTDRAERYRDQLAGHGAGMLRQLHRRDHAGGPPIHAATVTGGSVVLDLAWGRCTISATDGALVLVAEAETHDDLARIQAGVGQRVSSIGRRDGLTVTWTPTEAEPSDDAVRGAGLGRRRPALTTGAGVAVIGAVVAVHLGIGAAVLRQQWAWWAVAAIAALVVLKLVVARHLLAARHGHRPRRP